MKIADGINRVPTPTSECLSLHGWSALQISEGHFGYPWGSWARLEVKSQGRQRIEQCAKWSRKKAQDHRDFNLEGLWSWVHRSSDTLKRIGVMRFKITCYYGKLVIIPISQPTIALGISRSLVMLNCDLWLQCSSNTMHPWSMQVTNHQSPNPFQTQLPYPPLQISVAKEWT